MSLLLDALNRASRDKAAAAALQKAKPSAGLTSTATGTRQAPVLSVSSGLLEAIKPAAMQLPTPTDMPELAAVPFAPEATSPSASAPASNTKTTSWTTLALVPVADPLTPHAASPATEQATLTESAMTAQATTPEPVAAGFPGLMLDTDCPQGMSNASAPGMIAAATALANGETPFEDAMPALVDARPALENTVLALEDAIPPLKDVGPALGKVSPPLEDVIAPSEKFIPPLEEVIPALDSVPSGLNPQPESLQVMDHRAEPAMTAAGAALTTDPAAGVLASSANIPHQVPVPLGDTTIAQRVVQGVKAAQALLRAKAPPQQNKNSRVVVLAGVAAVLALSMGSVLFGVWGDPMTLIPGLGASSQGMVRAPVPPPPQATSGDVAVAVLPPAITLAPSQADASPSAVAPVTSASGAAAPGATAPAPAPATVAVAATETPKAAASQATAAGPGAKAKTQPKTGDPSSQGAAPHVARTALACGPGTRSPECPVPSRTAPAAPERATAQASVQTRLSGPSDLEQGYSALTQGRLQEAGLAYALALAKNPDERDALLGLAYIAQKQGRSDEAVDFYKRVLRQEPGNADARSGLLMLNPPGDSQDMGSRSRDVAEQNPDSAAAQSVLGHALVRQGRLADARLAFARAQQLEPNVARHAFNLAVALDRLRQYDEARYYYGRAIALAGATSSVQDKGFALADAQARLEQLRAASPVAAVPN